MIKQKQFRFVVLIITLSFLAISCGKSKSEGSSIDTTPTKETVINHGEGKEYNSAYVCPMHCDGSGGDEEGTCPVCGMDYVELSTHVEDGHNHKETHDSHEGHNH